jgi:hypothetical protein
MTDPFAHRVPTPEQIARVEQLRRAYLTLLQTIERLCPTGRYRSIAVTDLESSCMFAIKEIVFEEKETGG